MSSQSINRIFGGSFSRIQEKDSRDSKKNVVVMRLMGIFLVLIVYSRFKFNSPEIIYGNNNPQ